MSRPHRVAVGTLCTLILLVLPGWVMRHERADEAEQRRAQLEEVRSQNAELSAENHRMHEQLTGLEEGGDRLEHSVRDRLGWVRDNELVVVFETVEGGE